VGQGYTTFINITVTNQALNYETFHVIIYANTTAIATQTVTLTSGNSATITFTWNTTGFAKGNYTVWAYAWPVLGETVTSDNTFTDGSVQVTKKGDVNGDNEVNVLDLIIVAVHLDHVGGDGHTPGTKEWFQCMNADVKEDNDINVLDLIIVANYLGT